MQADPRPPTHLGLELDGVGIRVHVGRDDGAAELLRVASHAWGALDGGVRESREDPLNQLQRCDPAQGAWCVRPRDPHHEHAWLDPPLTVHALGDLDDLLLARPRLGSCVCKRARQRASVNSPRRSPPRTRCSASVTKRRTHVAFSPIRLLTPVYRPFLDTLPPVVARLRSRRLRSKLGERVQSLKRSDCSPLPSASPATTEAQAPLPTSAAWRGGGPPPCAPGCLPRHSRCRASLLILARWTPEA